MKHIIFKQHILVEDIQLHEDEINHVKSIKVSKKNKDDLMLTNYFENFNDEKCIKIIRKYEHVFEEIRVRNNYQTYKLTKFWVQKYNNEDYHDIHTHGTQDNHYSFIIYIDCSKNSSVTLFYALGYPYTSYVGKSPYGIKPEKGRIILFNSFLPHGLVPNKDEKRLVLSGNITYD